MIVIRQQIKSIIIFFALILSVSIYAQKENTINKTFVRIYNLEGKKINKGYVSFVNDTILGLKNKDKIDIRDIGYLKTKRSAGNNVLVGAILGAVTGGVIGAVSAEPESMFLSYTATEGGSGGGIIGGLGGGVIGGVTALFKKSKTYLVSVDPLLWKGIKKRLRNK